MGSIGSLLAGLQCAGTVSRLQKKYIDICRYNIVRRVRLSRERVRRFFGMIGAAGQDVRLFRSVCDICVADCGRNVLHWQDISVASGVIGMRKK
jgi:hypothetical protein